VVTPVRVALHWSGGKDSAHALGRLLADDRYEVRCLMTTVHAAREESSVHGLPTRLIRAQADAVGLPLRVVSLSSAGLDDYLEVMELETRRLKGEGIQAFAFGDLEASGVLPYKLAQFGPLGMEVVEPLWGMSSHECIRHFLATGIEAITVVVDAGVLDRRHLGVAISSEFVEDLPVGCDPCGEAGEYHTFVWNAPYFREPIPFTSGTTERVQRRIRTTEGLRDFAYYRLHLS
jgi:uncharacterized protein (TIGR00290 family)